jgi:hypothetical protein
MATYHVPDTGNPVTNMANLQSRLDSVGTVPGDIITLAAGVLYQGTLSLPQKSNPSGLYITITTDTPENQLPADGERIDPKYAPLMPVFQPITNWYPTIKTCNPSAGVANYYHLKFLHLKGSTYGGGYLLSLGSYDTSLANKQDTLAKTPHHLKADRCYIHGLEHYGQTHGVGLHCQYGWVIGCYITDCWGLSQDAQAIHGVNGPGDYVIDNNFIEGAGENVLMGGSDPCIPNLVPQNLTFTRNDVTKRLEWMGPILDQPQNLTLTPGTGGSLSAGDHTYCVTAVINSGYTGLYYRSTPLLATVTTAANGKVTLTWNPVDGAQTYRVYRDNSVYWSITVPTTQFVDTGQAGTSGGWPTTDGSRRCVKNLFELKNFDGALIRGNRFFYNWPPDQSGVAILFTPANQDGTNDQTVVQNITFEYNWISHTSAVFLITSYHAGTTNYASQRTNHIIMRHNLITDMGWIPWGGAGRDLQLGVGAGPLNPWLGSDYITYEHNTGITNGKNSFLYIDGYQSGTYYPMEHVVIKNNISTRGSYGVLGSGSSEGTDTLNDHCPNWVFERNAISGAASYLYPANNYYLTEANHRACFVDYLNGNYRIATGSTYKGAATDGSDLGADLDTLFGYLSTCYDAAPIGDVALAGWVPSFGDDAAHQLDDADDATLIESSDTSTAEVQIDSTVDLPSTADVTVKVRCKTA